ncbi:MAG: hypothetical protein ACR2KJ_12440 [Jatrophihabitans sp.]
MSSSHRSQLSRGEDEVGTATWAGSVPVAHGVAPRVRVGRSRWFNLLWLLPIGFVALIVAVAVAKGLRTPGKDWFRIHKPVPSDPLWTANKDSISVPGQFGLPGPRHSIGQLELAQRASSGHSAHTVYGGHEHVLRQTVIALAAGANLDDQENPGEATGQVLGGRVRLAAGDTGWEGSPGDLLTVPDTRHSLEALGASTICSPSPSRDVAISSKGCLNAETGHPNQR